MAARLAGALSVIALAACASTAVRVADDERTGDRTALDLCLGDSARPLDDAARGQVRAVWEALARGEHPAPLHLLNHSAGRCMATWWTPVVPLAACGEVAPVGRSLDMPGLGRVDVDGAGHLTFVGVEAPPLEHLGVDGRDVSRRLVGDGQVVYVKTARGPALLPGFPEHVIDDRHVLALVGEGAVLYDVETGASTPVRPTRTPTSIAGSVVVPDAAATNGVRAVGALDFGSETWLAFVVDGAGRELAHLEGPRSRVGMPAVTRDDVIVLAALIGDGTTQELRVVTVDGGRAQRRSVPLSDVAFGSADVITAGGGAGAIVVGVGSRAVIFPPGAAPPVMVETIVPPNIAAGMRTLAPLVVLDGGHIAALHVRGGSDGTVVVDLRDGRELLRVTDAAPRVTEGASSLVLVDSQAADTNYAIVVDRDGKVTRGPVGTTKVGRFELQTFAGIPDPSRACDAKALSLLPPIVQYPTENGAVFLPASLVVP